MYRAAIIGLGNIAWLYDQHQPENHLTHYSALDGHSDVSMLTAFDSDLSQAKRFEQHAGVDAVESIEALLELGPDIVSIASPAQFHASQLAMCVDAKVPMIWLEKPVCVTREQSEMLSRLATSQVASKILVGYQRRYLPAYQRLRDTINKRHLGDCVALSVVYSRGLLSNGIHLIDILGFVLNDEVVVEYTLPRSEGNSESPSFLLKMESGITCSVTGLDMDMHSIDITAHFSQGRAHVWHGGFTEFSEVKTDNALYPGFHRLDFDANCQIPEAQLYDENAGVMSLLLNDLIAAYEQDRQPKSNLSTALAAQVLVDKLLEKRL